MRTSERIAHHSAGVGRRVFCGKLSAVGTHQSLYVSNASHYRTCIDISGQRTHVCICGSAAHAVAFGYRCGTFVERSHHVADHSACRNACFAHRIGCHYRALKRAVGERGVGTCSSNAAASQRCLFGFAADSARCPDTSGHFQVAHRTFAAHEAEQSEHRNILRCRGIDAEIAYSVAVAVKDSAERTVLGKVYACVTLAFTDGSPLYAHQVYIIGQFVVGLYVCRISRVYLLGHEHQLVNIGYSVWRSRCSIAALEALCRQKLVEIDTFHIAHGENRLGSVGLCDGHYLCLCRNRGAKSRCGQ